MYLGSGADFVNTPQLRLSTASRLKFGAGQFDVFSSTADDLALLRGEPLPGALGLQAAPQLNSDAGVLPGIHLNGINISIDEDLLIDAPGRPVAVENSTLSVSSEEEVGGTLTLTGDRIDVDGNSQLLATGPESGGLIQVGGSRQNSDPLVRQAVKTTVQSGAVFDASATGMGDGGEIVVWSDITHPESLTSVSGSLFVEAGVAGGDGGRIETSGADLDVAGVQISTKAEKGDAGLWLLDPTDFYINAAIAQSIVNALSDCSTYSGCTVTSSPATDVTIQVGSDTQSSTPEGSISPLNPQTGPTGRDRIVIDSDIVWGGYSGFHESTLTLNATGDIVLNGVNRRIESTGVSSGSNHTFKVNLIIESAHGGLTGNSSALIKVGSLIVDQEGDSTFAGTLNINDKTGSGITDFNNAIVFEKRGSGALNLTGTNSFTKEGWAGLFGSPPSNFDSFLKIAEGTLVFGAPGALGDSADVIVFDDGVLRYTAASAGVDVSARLVNAAASGSGAISFPGKGTGGNTDTYKIDTGGQNIVFGSFIGAWEGSHSVSVQKPNYGSPTEGHHDGISYPVSGYIG